MKKLILSYIPTLLLLPCLAIADEPKSYCPSSFNSNPSIPHGSCAAVCEPAGDKDCLSSYVDYTWAYAETGELTNICCIYSKDNTLDVYQMSAKKSDAADCEKYTCGY